MRDEFVSAFAAFRAGDLAKLNSYLADSTCIACGGPGPLKGGLCEACNEDVARSKDEPYPVTFDRDEVPGSTCNAACGWCGRCS